MGRDILAGAGRNALMGVRTVMEREEPAPGPGPGPVLVVGLVGVGVLRPREDGCCRDSRGAMEHNVLQKLPPLLGFRCGPSWVVRKGGSVRRLEFAQ